MRGKTARELRKIAQFNPNVRREYEAWTVVASKYVLQFDNKGNFNMVKKPLERTIIECVTGSRKVYQHLKRFYNGQVQEQEMRALPSKAELKELEKTILSSKPKDEENE